MRLRLVTARLLSASRGRASAARAILLLVCLGLPGVARADRSTAVAAGYDHSCALTTTGGVQCWGSNRYQQLGDGTSTSRTTAAAVTGLTTGVASILAGRLRSCAVTTAGGAKCWGYNYYGQLGDGTQTDRSTPVDVVGLTIVAALVGGDSHTCALTTDGGVKCWGSNTHGELGDGTATTRVTPVAVSGLASGVLAIAAGGSHTCAMTTAGALKCWGRNNRGQLGDGTALDRNTPVDVPALTSGVSAVSAGFEHTCVVASGGAVRCWGYNGFGQLGDGTTTDRVSPVDASGLTAGVRSISAGMYHTCAVTSDGGARCWGDTADGQTGTGTAGGTQLVPADVVDLTSGVMAVAAGGHHSCALSTEGAIWCWGLNRSGELGDGLDWRHTSPAPITGLGTGNAKLSAGTLRSCAVTSGATAKCWGYNYDGVLGDGTWENRAAPVDVVGLTGTTASVSAGGGVTCAVTASGGAQCWGRNDYGQLGDGTTTARSTPADVSGLTSGVAAVVAAGDHACALTTTGGVKCWGSNGSGRLGDGTTNNRSAPVDVSGLTSGVLSITAGGSGHTCAVTATHGAKCWGRNYYGQLGDGSTTNRLVPVDVSGLTSGVAALSAGQEHTCAVMVLDGAVKCWGLNSSGQLGDESNASRTTATAVSGLSSGASAVTAGGGHTCALTTVGAVLCWGSNAYGQVGDGTLTSRTTPVAVATLAGTATAASAGDAHSCALLTDGSVSCWGSNEYGQLGDGALPYHARPGQAVGLTGGETAARPSLDFDADQKADVAVYRASAGTWFSLDSSTGNTSYRYRGWGVEAQGDIPVIGDFDGDGLVDPAVFRPANGTWFILESNAGYTTWDWYGWGISTDVQVAGDYDADGKMDAAVYRPSTGTWYVKPSGGGTPWNLVFGQPGDVPVAGDFDGDGRRDPAVYRASTGTWFWLKSSTNLTTYAWKGWGVDALGDTPAPGDFDGDGRTDPCVFRPGTGTWFVLESHAGFTTWQWFGWGVTGDLVVPADYDGDGRTDAAVYRPATGTWYIRPSSGATQWSAVFGAAGDVPLVTTR